MLKGLHALLVPTVVLQQLLLLVPGQLQALLADIVKQQEIEVDWMVSHDQATWGRAMNCLNMPSLVGPECGMQPTLLYSSMLQITTRWLTQYIFNSNS